MKNIIVLLLLCVASVAIAQNPHIPRAAIVVAEVDLLQQTGPQSVVLYTPSADGLFRVSSYIELFGPTVYVLLEQL